MALLSPQLGATEPRRSPNIRGVIRGKSGDVRRTLGKSLDA